MEGSFLSLKEVEATSAFKSLDYEKQMQVRSEWAGMYLNQVDGFNALDRTKQQQVAHAIITAPPVFQDQGEKVAWAYDIAERVKAGDIEAKEVAKQRLFFTESTRSSIVGNIIAGITSVFEGGEDYSTTYGKDGQKINALLMQSLNYSPSVTREELDALKTQIGVASFGINFIEGLATNMALVGSIGKAGLLTKGLLGPGGRISNFAAGMRSGIMQSTIAEFGEQAVQSVIGAGISLAENSALMAFQNDGQRMEFNEAAKYLGNDILFDWAVWAFITPAITASKAIIFSLRGFDSANDSLKKLIATEGPEAISKRVYDVASGANFDEPLMQSIKHSSSDLYETVLAQHNGAKAVKKAFADGLDTPLKKAIVSADVAGYILREEGDEVLVHPKENPLNSYKFNTLDEAVRYAVKNSSVVDTAISVGAASDIGLSKSFKTVLSPKTQYSTGQLRKILTPEAGHLSDENAKFFVANTVTSSGVNEKIAEFVDGVSVIRNNDAFAIAAKNPSAGVKMKRLVLPAEITSADMERSVRKYLYDYSLELGKLDSNKSVLDGIRVRTEAVEKEIQSSFLSQPGSLEGVKFIANKHLGLDVKFSDHGKIKIGEVTYDSPEAANQFLYAELFRQGKFDYDEAKIVIKNMSGLSLDASPNPKSGTVTYALRQPGGGIIGQDTDLAMLVETSPELTSAFRDMRLPYELAPKTWIISAKTGEAIIKLDTVSGSLDEISKFSNKFLDIKRTRKGGTKLVDTLDDKDVALDVHSGIFTVRDRLTGIEREFTTSKEATNYIKREANNWNNYKKEFDARGYVTMRGPKGVLVAIDMDGVQHNFSSKTELDEFFSSHPLPGSNSNIFGGDPEVDAKIHAENKLTVEETLHVTKLREKINNVLRSKTFSQILLPVESNMEDIARSAKNPKLLEAWRGFSAGVRTVNAKNSQYKPIVDGIWERVPKKDYDIITELLNTSEEDWDATFAAFGRKTDDSVIRVVRQAQAFYKEFAVSSSGNIGRPLTYYAPRVSKYLAQLKAAGKEPPTNASAMLKEMFGEDIPAHLSFFAENARRDLFLDMINDRNPYRAMSMYVTQMNKKVFMGSPLESAKNLLRDLKPEEDGFTKADIDYFKASIAESLGFKTPAAKRIQQGSLDLTTKIYDKMVKNLGKTKAFRDVDLEKYIVTDDLIGKLNSYFTISTQAFRMWAIPRNLTQVSLLGAIVGNKRAWDAMAYSVDNPDYINKLIMRGNFSENLYNGHENMTSTKSLIQMSLNPLENSDMITRAASYRAAETLIDDALPRYHKGIISKKELLKEINADILDADLQTKVLDMIDTNNIDGAKDMMGIRFTDMTMFNYSKGSQGTAFRGVAGRLFGKLGVYPVGTISLYRDILSRGSPDRVLGRAARLIATTSAIYWAFKSVGIDYSGFLWTDPFEFSGGPYWVMMNDLLQSFGSNSDSAMTRARLINSAARTAVPSVFRYWVDAANYMADGRPYEAMLALATTPMNKALKENGSFDGTMLDW